MVCCNLLWTLHHVMQQMCRTAKKGECWSQTITMTCCYQWLQSFMFSKSEWNDRHMNKLLQFMFTPKGWNILESYQHRLLLKWWTCQESCCVCGPTGWVGTEYPSTNGLQCHLCILLPLRLTWAAMRSNGQHEYINPLEFQPLKIVITTMTCHVHPPGQ